MADEIRQEMGFDASQALATIDKLNAGFQSLFQTLNAAPRSFDAFNQGAAKTVSALSKIQSQAKLTAAALASASSPKAGATNVGGAGSAQATQQAQALTTNLNQSATAANKAGAAVSQAGTQSANSLTKATRAGSGFAVSLETITRVIATQAIVRSISGVQRAIEDSFQSFIEFQNGLATIRTLLPQSFESLTQELTGLSNAFNVPLLDVVKAKYEIIQNGFDTAAESATILNAALKFSRITNADAAASADLVSSSLNAYSQSAGEADNITAKLVKTIDLGRISGSELVSAFGRVAPIGKEIGATTDELLAAFSSISIGGVRASEAATQIRATLTALLKPSEAMKESFARLGIETGDQAIQTFGFKGALDQLIGTTNGSTSAIAKLFPNIRALNGVLRTTGSGASVFEEHLKEIRNTSLEILNKKFELRIDSNAEKVTAELNKLKNFLTTEIGSELVNKAGQFIKLAGGADSIANAVKSFTPAIVALTAAMVLNATATSLVARAHKTLTAEVTKANIAARVLGGTLTVVSLAFAAFQTGKFIGGQFTAAFEEADKKARDELSQRTQFEAEQSAARLNIARLDVAERSQLLNKYVADSRKAYFKDVENAKTANESLISTNKETLHRIIEARDKFAQDLRRAATTADEAIVDSRKVSNDLIIKLSDAKFTRENKKLSEQAQLQNQRQRAEQVAALAKKQLLAADTVEEVAAARASAERAESWLDQALSTAKSLGSVQQIKAVEDQIEALTKRRIAQELKFQKIKKDQAATIREAAAKEEERVSKLKILAETFLEKSNAFDSSGKALPADKAKKNAEDAKKALKELKALAFDKSSAISIADIVSFDTLEHRMQQAVSKGEVTNLFSSDKTLDTLNDQIQGSIGRKTFIVDKLKLAGIDVSSLEDLSDVDAQQRATELISEQKETIEKMAGRVSEREKIESKIREHQEAQATSMDRPETTGERIARGLKRTAEIFTFDGFSDSKIPNNAEVAQQEQQLQTFRDKIKQGTNDPKVSSKFINDLGAQLNKFQSTASDSLAVRLAATAREFKDLQETFALRQQIAKLEKDGPSTQEAVDKAQNALNSATSDLAIKKQIEDALKRSKDETEAAKLKQTSWNDAAKVMVTATQTIATNLNNAANAMDRINGGGFEAPTLPATGGVPGVQSNGAVIASSAPRSVTANTPASAVSGGTNVNVTQNITSSDPKVIAQQLIPEINRAIRRSAVAIRTA